MIYLDNAATTPMFLDALEIYKKYAVNNFYNPSAVYSEGFAIKKELDEIKNDILKKLNAKNGNIIFTSGATESNNLAILGSKKSGSWEYVFTQGEHPSVYNVAKELEKQGNVVHFVKLQENGQVDYDKLKGVLNDRTRLISTIHVNNETGAVNDVIKIEKLRKTFAQNALLHVDGVQAFCKIPVNLNNVDIDLYTISAHKFHGPKGVGALYIKNMNLLRNITFGGGQEFGIRSGTENVPAIMSMGYVLKKIDVENNYKKVKILKKSFLDIISKDNNIKFYDNESPYILSLSFKGVNGETLMRELQSNGVLVGIGSACSSKKAGNRILESMGESIEKIKTHIRVSFNAYQEEKDIEDAAKIILKTYRNLFERVK